MQDEHTIQGLKDFKSKTDGLPLLYLAAKSSNLRTVKTIVSNTKIEHTDTDMDGRSLAQFLWVEKEFIDKEKIQLLHQHEQISDSDFFVMICAKGFDPLEQEDKYMHTFVQSYIKKNGVNMKGRNIGQFPIYAASRSGHDSLVSMLIENNADVTLQNEDEETPLWISCLKGNANIAEILLEGAKADNSCDVTTYVNQADENDKSPIWICAWLNHVDVMKILVRYNANVDNPDSLGRSPLRIAIEQENLDGIELLRAHRAQIAEEERQQIDALMKRLRYEYICIHIYKVLCYCIYQFTCAASWLITTLICPFIANSLYRHF